jgi:hypothetical protein
MTSGKIKIKEGNEYEFLVEKELTMPDNSRHFVLKGPDQNKFLIPSATYSHYNIKTGTSIKCRIDKINCKGEVFLEPENPCYSENKSYLFEVTGYETRTDTAGERHDVVIVLDIFGNRIPVVYENDKVLPVIGSRLKLIVERITKGKIYLHKRTSREINRHLKLDHDYEFEIIGLGKGMDDEEYFIMKDYCGITHTLSRKFYEYYGLEPGKRFNGRIIKYRKGGERIIEPENPFYKTGSLIRLEIVSKLKNFINDSFMLNLRDAFGFVHCIEIPKEPVKGYIDCRIVKIRKGKPLLEPV